LTDNRYILGISALFHDSAAVLVQNGRVIAACQEERLTRVKGDSSFPINSIKYCLDQEEITVNDLEAVVFYEKPFRKLNRIISNEIKINRTIRNLFKSHEGEGIFNFWYKRGMFDFESMLEESLREVAEMQGKAIKKIPKFFFSNHHLSHAASAFIPSNFSSAAILTIDGVGEWDTTVIYKAHRGDKNEISIRKMESMRYPNSLGLLYATFTSFLGFKVNSGEYKVMGLAPYGVPRYVKLIEDNCLRFNNDGNFELDRRFFTFNQGRKMYSKGLEHLFNTEPRLAESDLTEIHFDIAASIQEVTNKLVLKLAEKARDLTGSKRLVLAGGVALNCVSNSKIVESGLFEEIWIQPAAGDAGGALGAALALGFTSEFKKRSGRQVISYERKSRELPSAGKFENIEFSPFLGPEFRDFEIKNSLTDAGLKFEFLGENLCDYVSRRICEGAVVGWFQGRMEFGPRALGNRSILADPRGNSKRDEINLKIKFRESFRPFAPAVLENHLEDWFKFGVERDGQVEHLFKSPYMLFVAKSNSKEKTHLIPSCIHVDGTARAQTVSPDFNPLFYKLINKFYAQTNIPLLINTSFNIRGEPIVCSPTDAIRCFLGTDLDLLAIGPYVVEKQHNSNLLTRFYSELTPKD